MEALGRMSLASLNEGNELVQQEKDVAKRGEPLEVYL
jgi:hypothetical protein